MKNKDERTWGIYP